MLAVLGTIGALGLTVTKCVDLIRNLIDKQDTYPKYVWNIVALVVGLAFALGWQLNIAGSITALIPALKNASISGTAGQVLTGVIIGGSAGFFHELLDALSGVATTLQKPKA
jgi:hypothetical protein